MMQAETLIGQTLAVYRLDAVLDEDETSVIYQAWDPIQDRMVVLKVLKSQADPNLQEFSQEANQFIMKARSIATWKNEHIRQVYYAGEQDGLLFAAIELILGQTLAERLKENNQNGKPLPIFEVLQYGRAIADALDYAHLRGVPHGEVQPENIFILSDGRVLLDGFLKASDSIRSTPFTAPEQIEDPNVISPESDLFSFGAVLYRMLTGQKPYTDHAPVIERGQTIPLPPPADELNPELNDKVDVVLLRSMMYDSQERYHSGAEVMEALQAALVDANLPVHIPVPHDVPEPLEALVAFPTEEHQLRADPNAQPKIRMPARLPLWKFIGLGFLGVVGITILLFIGIFWTNRASSPISTLPSLTISYTATPSQIQSASTSTTSMLASGAPIVPTEIRVTSPVPKPSSTPSPSLTPASTLTAQPSSTYTLPPTQSPTETGTPIYFGGRHFILYYNDSSFYMYQSEGYEGGPIEPVAFERLDEVGNPTDRFPGVNFSLYYPNTALGYCMRIEIQDALDYLRPSECQGYLVTRWPAADSDIIFWTKKAGSTQFRVSWNRTEVAHCEIAAGTCEFYLP